jgi:hypothetical protein
MARAKGWYTVAEPSGTIGFDSWTGAQVIAAGLEDPTILRTRASFTIASANEVVPPFYPGNSFDPMALRIIAHPDSEPPDEFWYQASAGPDDLIFHPIIWDQFLYVPANLGVGRPDSVFATGSLAGGLADSAGQRHFPGSVDVAVSWYAGPVLGVNSFADPELTVSWWIRCLIEATI